MSQKVCLGLQRNLTQYLASLRVGVKKYYPWGIQPAAEMAKRYLYCKNTLSNLNWKFSTDFSQKGRTCFPWGYVNQVMLFYLLSQVLNPLRFIDMYAAGGTSYTEISKFWRLKVGINLILSCSVYAGSSRVDWHFHSVRTNGLKWGTWICRFAGVQHSVVISIQKTQSTMVK